MIENASTSAQPTDPKKLNEQSLYDYVNLHMNEQEFAREAIFLNYGYVPNAGPQHAQLELPPERRSRNSIKLVLETVGDCDLTGKDVLDVGCGRGGTIATIREFFEPRTLTGIDLSPRAIAFCQSRHAYDNVRFMEGDAEDLPFPAHSFDAVTNIESACCYPNIAAFYKEAARVLRPGGYFLYADIIATEVLDYRLELLKQHFTVERFRDITSNILLSCDQIAERRFKLMKNVNEEKLIAGILQKSKPKDYDKLMGQLICVPGSSKYNKMRDGVETYVAIKLHKEASGEEQQPG
jgi:ubiquinone/menaquinone biosynthesis C-methylase UbiE